MKEQIREMNVIKGICILAVAVIHATGTFLSFSAEPGNIYFYLNHLSRFSVPVFFLSSGLLLFYQYHDREPFPLWNFWRKRSAFILSPFLIWSLIYTAYLWWDNPHNLTGTVTDNLIKILLGQGYYHLYFLFVLVQLYFLFPLLLKGFKKLPDSLILVLTLWVSILALSFNWNEWTSVWGISVDEYNIRRFFPVWLFYFAFGGWLGMNWQKVRKQLNSISLSAIALTAILLAFLMTLEVGLENRSGFYSLVTVPYAITLFVLVYRLARQFSLKGISLIGRHSFGVYLMHPMVQALWVKFQLVPKPFYGFLWLLAAMISLPLLITMGLHRFRPGAYLVGK
ncbi:MULTISPECIES: acyltransferase [unclassified Thermoactinomyces]|uniref:acyltransferase n=1 Tax=unclassified Thermoactinomyces TaxID=2634588 RepID=UPI0018DB6471|nr:MULTISPECIES: acyltransferase [unclassified Thermoactinomyces]MBH8596962.1 acyltransferase [Thermoactinomyces sp. CICC 10523]MBH8603738.1 acyltransferase [Thermoactinomyces sp. CICC 10522]MBH8607627.1 acyltransferase [Thermoactinomyces sp. CICC 10521]